MDTTFKKRTHDPQSGLETPPVHRKVLRPAVAGTRGALRRPLDGRLAGIETVYQELAVATELDITQNLLLGRELRKLGIRCARQIGSAISRHALRMRSMSTLETTRMPVRSHAIQAAAERSTRIGMLTPSPNTVLEPVCAAMLRGLPAFVMVEVAMIGGIGADSRRRAAEHRCEKYIVVVEQAG